MVINLNNYHTLKRVIALIAIGLFIVVLNTAGVLKAGSVQVFAGRSSAVAGSSATLYFTDDITTSRSFRWKSSDAILGEIDTGIIEAARWNTSGPGPSRLVFTGQANNGAIFFGNVLFEPYNRAVIDVIHGRRIRYVLTLDSINSGPFIEIIEPDGQQNELPLNSIFASGDAADSSFTIRWLDEDIDDNADIHLAYHPDNSANAIQDNTETGPVIVKRLKEDEQCDAFVWDTSKVPDGKYLISGIIDDGVNAPFTDFSEDRVNINHGFSVDEDSDQDQLPDEWERNFGLNPNDPNDAVQDPDNDSLNSLTEFKLKTNPIDADTDHDGIWDALDTSPLFVSNNFEANSGNNAVNGTWTNRNNNNILIQGTENGGTKITAVDTPENDIIISLCETKGELHLDAGDEVLVNCDNLQVKALTQQISIRLNGQGKSAVLTLNQGNTLSYDSTTQTVTADTSNTERLELDIDAEMFFIEAGQEQIVPIDAPRITWTGEGLTNNWSDAENWSSGNIPGEDEIALFDATSENNVVIDIAVSVSGIDVRQEYRGSIDASEASVMVQGDFTLLGGLFIAPQIQESLIVSGNITLSEQAIFEDNKGSLTLTRDVGKQTLNAGGDNSDHDFFNLIHSGEGTVQLVKNPLKITGHFTNSLGTFDFNNINAEFSGQHDADSVAWDSSGGTFHTGHNTITFSYLSPDTRVVAGGVDDFHRFHNLFLNSEFSGIIKFQEQDVYIDGNLSIQASGIFLDSVDMILNGDLNIISAQDGSEGTGELIFAGESLQTIRNPCSDLDYIATVRITNSSLQGVRQMGDFGVAMFSMEPDSQFSVASHHLLVKAATSDSAWNIDKTAVFDAGSGTVHIGSQFTINPDIHTGGIDDNHGFHHLILETGSPTQTITLANDGLDIDGNLTLGAGNLNQGIHDITLAGNLIISTADAGAVIHSGARFIFDGTEPQIISNAFADNDRKGDWLIQQDAHVLLNNAVTVNTLSIEQEALFDLNGQTLTIASQSFSNEGILQLQGNEPINWIQDSDSGLWRYVGDGEGNANEFVLQDLGEADFYNVEFAGQSDETFALGGAINVVRDLAINQGTLHANGSNITVQGNFTSDATLQLFGIETITLPNGQEIEMGSWKYIGDGPGGQTSFAIRDWGEIDYFDIEIAGQADEVFYLNGNDLSLAADMFLTSGVFHANGRTVVVNGNFLNEAVFQLIGAESINLANGQDTDGGTWRYVGDGAGGQNVYTIMDWGEVDYFSLEMAGQADETFILGATDLNINGDLIITAGTLDSNDQPITLGYEWINHGNFLSRLNTVTFRGDNNVIRGNTTFYNLSKQVGFDRELLAIESGSTQIINGTTTLIGEDVGNPLVIESTATDLQGTLDPRGTVNVSFLDVQDNNSTVEIQCLLGCADSGNNTNWIFELFQPPSAQISATMTQGSVPLDIEFDGSDSTSPNGQINQWAWNFGDGEIAMGPSANHTFTIPGLYAVTLTVTDSEEQIDDQLLLINAFPPGNPRISDKYRAIPLNSTSAKTRGLDINNNAHVVGWLKRRGMGIKAKLWTPDVDKFTEIPIMIGDADGACEQNQGVKKSEAHGISNDNQIVGWAKIKKCGIRGFFGDAHQTAQLLALKLNGGGVDEKSSQLEDVNNRQQMNTEGQMVGFYQIGRRNHAFLKESNNINIIPLNGAAATTNSKAFGINENGEVVGASNGGVFWNIVDDRCNDITKVGGNRINAINDIGQSTGIFFDADTRRPKASWWNENCEFQELVFTSDDEANRASQAFDINENGQLVGFFNKEVEFERRGETRIRVEQHAFLYDTTNSELHDINDLVDATTRSELTFHKARAINDFGDIIAEYIKGKKIRTYVLTKNTRPIAQGQSIKVIPNTPLEIFLQATDDAEEIETLCFEVQNVIQCPSPVQVTKGTLSQSAQCSANLTYTPNADFSGNDVFTFSVTDRFGERDCDRVVLTELDLFGDDDGDGLPNGWEVYFGLDPFSAEGDNGALGDPDDDGLTNWQEFEACKNQQDYKTCPDPKLQDTDGDLNWDGFEVMGGLDPTDASDGLTDPDQDNLNNHEEFLECEDKKDIDTCPHPNNGDTDDDGFSDGDEVKVYKTDPNDPSDASSIDPHPPVIFDLIPADGSQTSMRRPRISANFFDADPSSGIRLQSITILLNGEDITNSTDTNVTVSGLTFNPVQGLRLGQHQISVSVSDRAGNPMSASWSFTIKSGEDGGAFRVRDINPGPPNSNPDSLEASNGLLFFSANDGTHGSELWVTDGTDAGLQPVRGFSQGITSSRPSQLTNVNGTLYFLASQDNSDRLWKSDGSASGTVQLKRLPLGNTILIAERDRLYIIAGVLGSELWVSQGTETSTIHLKTFGGGIGATASAGGLLYLSAFRDEIWRSDGTETGTVRVKDIRPGSANSFPQELIYVNGTLFFTADNGEDGRELWKSDGSTAGTVLVKDISPGSADSNPARLTDVNGTLFFTAYNSAHGRELWKSDGTAAGTVLVKDIFVGTTSSTQNHLTNVGGTLFFVSSGGGRSRLYKSDGTATGTILVKDFFVGFEGETINNLTSVNGALFFTVFDAEHGNELWSSDGTPVGTGLVEDIFPGGDGSDPRELTNFNGVLYFSANDPSHGRELWLTEAVGGPPPINACNDSPHQPGDFSVDTNGSDVVNAGLPWVATKYYYINDAPDVMAARQTALQTGVGVDRYIPGVINRGTPLPISIENGVLSPTTRMRVCATVFVGGVDVQFNQATTDATDTPMHLGPPSGQATISTFSVDSVELLLPIARGTGGVRPALKHNVVAFTNTVTGAQLLYQIHWIELSFDAMSPSVLVHGKGANRHFWRGFPAETGTDNRGKATACWPGFADDFEQANIPFDESISLGVIADPPSSSQLGIVAQALQLQSKLPGGVASFGTHHFNLIAHSKGGLDSRHWLTNVKIASDNLILGQFITLDTPHRGSVVADYAIVGSELTFLTPLKRAAALGAAASVTPVECANKETGCLSLLIIGPIAGEFFGMSANTEATRDLQTFSMARFNNGTGGNSGNIARLVAYRNPVDGTSPTFLATRADADTDGDAEVTNFAPDELSGARCYDPSATLGNAAYQALRLVSSAFLSSDGFLEQVLLPVQGQQRNDLLVTFTSAFPDAILGQPFQLIGTFLKDHGLVANDGTARFLRQQGHIPRLK